MNACCEFFSWPKFLMILKDSVSDTQREGKVIQAKKKISEEKSRKMKGILLFTQTFLSQFFWHISTLPWQ